jgi:hypothetical protein
MKTRVLLLAVLLVVSTILSQAKSQKPPLFASPDFNPAQIDRVDVFVVDPSNDVANDRECILGAKFGSIRVRGGADPALGKRGYNKGKRRTTQFYTLPITLSDAMLSNPSKDWLQDLANRKYFDRKSNEVPPPGQWIMIITIDELGSRDNSVKGPGRATLSMYFYDRDQGTLLWHDQATEKMCGGLLGNLMEKGDIKQTTCGTLAYAMIMKLPKHPK